MVAFKIFPIFHYFVHKDILNDILVNLVQHTPGRAGGGWDYPDDTIDHGNISEQCIKHTPGKAGGGWEDEEEEEGTSRNSVSSQDGIKNLTW